VLPVWVVYRGGLADLHRTLEGEEWDREMPWASAGGGTRGKEENLSITLEVVSTVIRITASASQKKITLTGRRSSQRGKKGYLRADMQA